MARLLDLLALELRRRTRDPLAFLMWTAIPFLMVVLMVAVFGPKGGGLPSACLLVVDHDGSFASQALVSALSSPRLKELLEVEVVEPERAAREMGRGRASALLVIPDRFGADLLANRPVSLELARNPAETVLPQLAEEVLTFLADAGTALRAVLVSVTGEESLFQREPTMAEVTALAGKLFTLAQDPETRRLVDPATLTVTPRHPQAKALTRSVVVGWFAPGMIVMAMLFLAQGQSSEIQEDGAAGLLLRSFSYPTPPATVLLSKALALIASGLGNGLALVIAMAVAVGWRPASPLLVAAALLAAAAALVGLALLLRGLTRTLAGGNAAAAGLMVGLGFLGGCFVPVQLLPRAFQSVALALPTGWAVDALRLAQGGAEASPLATAWRLAALALFAAATIAVAVRLEVRKAASP